MAVGPMPQTSGWPAVGPVGLVSAAWRGYRASTGMSALSPCLEGRCVASWLGTPFGGKSQLVRNTAFPQAELSTSLLVACGHSGARSGPASVGGSPQVQVGYEVVVPGCPTDGLARRGAYYPMLGLRAVSRGGLPEAPNTTSLSKSASQGCSG